MSELSMRIGILNGYSPIAIPPAGRSLARPRADRDPVGVYLASLAPGSRRTMSQALEVIARILTSGRRGVGGVPWSSLGHEHTAAVRAAMAEQYSPSTANKMLSALRGVLKSCWRLELMNADQYQRAVDVGLYHTHGRRAGGSWRG